VTEIVNIGRGLCRTTLRANSTRKRSRLESLPGIRIVGKRVIFPADMTGEVRRELRR